MSDTTELFTGSSGVPEASPGYSSDSGPSANAGAAAGTPAGPGLSPPAAGTASTTAGAGAPAGETVTDKPARQGGSGLSGLKLADLQRVAQSMGITGTGRMRKSQLVEAIQSKGGGGGAQAGWRPGSGQRPFGWPLGGQREWGTRQLSPAWCVRGSRRVSPA